MSEPAEKRIEIDASADEFAGHALGVSPLFVAIAMVAFSALFWWIAGRFAKEKDILAEVAVSTAELDAKRRAVDLIDKRHVVLLFGDSVFGRTILDEKTGGRPGEMSVVEAMRSEIDPSADVAIVDFSYDGLLPCDVAALLEILGESATSPRVDIVYGLTSRVLSRDYRAEPSAFSRELFRKASDSGKRTILFDPPSKSSPWLTDEGAGLARHRVGLGAARLALPESLRRPETWTVQRATEPASIDRSAAARIAPHFLAIDSSKDGAQRIALRDIADRVGRNGRAHVFLTPLLGEALGVADDDPRLLEGEAAIVATMRRTISTGQGVDVKNFDDEEFRDDLFLDHCHLTTAGNVRLARRILRSLAIPLRNYDSGAILEKDPDAALSIVAGPGKVGLRDGFGRLAIADAQRLHVVRPGVVWGVDDGGRVFEVVAATGSVTTLAEIEPAIIVDLTSSDDRRRFMWAPDGRGGAVVVEGDTLLHRVFDDRTQTTRYERAPGQLGFQPFVAIGGDRGVMILGGGPPHAYFLPIDATKTIDLGPVEGMVGNHVVAAAADNLGRVFWVNGNGDVLRSTPTVGNAVVTWKTETLFNNRSDLHAAALSALESSGGLSQNRWKDGATAFFSPHSIAVSRDGAWIFVADSGDRTSSATSALERRRSTTLWRLDAESRSGEAILAPGKDGIARRAASAEFLADDCEIVYDDDRGRIFAAVQGLQSVVSIEERLLRRTSWIVGGPPLAVATTKTFSGRTHPLPDEGTFRVGVFGSSMTVGHPVDGRIDTVDPDGKRDRPLSSTRSLGKNLEESLRRRIGGGPVRIEVADYSIPLASLLRQYVAAVACEPREIDTAIFCIDRTTLIDPVDRRPTMAESWHRLDRDAQGRPRIAIESGYCPAPVLKDSAEGSPPTAEAALEACFFAIVDLAEERGWKVVFVDISAIDGDRASGIPNRDARLGPRQNLIADAARRAGVPFFDAGAVLAERAGEGMPLSADNDRHFSIFGLLALGDLLARYFAHDMALAVYRKRLEPHAGAAAPTEEIDRSPRVPLRALGGSELEAAGIRAEECSRESTEKGFILTIDVTRDVTAPLMRRAAAAAVVSLAGRLRVGDEVVVRLVRYLRRNEYGLVDRSSTVPVATYRIAPTALDRLRAFSERPSDEANGIAEWLEPYREKTR